MSEVVVLEETLGTGPVAGESSQVRVRFTVMLEDGAAVADLKSPTPLVCELGLGDLIEGLDLGIRGMKVGGKRRLRVPPELGYGERGVIGLVPPGATLLIDVELVGIGR